MRYKIIQHLIWKLSDMVYMRQEGSVVAAVLTSVKISCANLLHKQGFVDSQMKTTVDFKHKWKEEILLIFISMHASLRSINWKSTVQKKAQLTYFFLPNMVGMNNYMAKMATQTDPIKARPDSKLFSTLSMHYKCNFSTFNSSSEISLDFWSFLGDKHFYLPAFDLNQN